MLSFGYFAHCPGSLSTLLDWVGSPLCGTFTICTMHCPLFAVWALWWLHNAIQTMCKRTSCVPSAGCLHKTIMVITVRAHCYPLDISPTAQAVWALSWIGWGAPFVGRSLFALCIAHCSQFEHSGDFTMQSKQCVNVLPVSQVQESP